MAQASCGAFTGDPTPLSRDSIFLHNALLLLSDEGFLQPVVRSCGAGPGCRLLGAGDVCPGMYRESSGPTWKNTHKGISGVFWDPRVSFSLTRIFRLFTVMV